MYSTTHGLRHLPGTAWIITRNCSEPCHLLPFRGLAYWPAAMPTASCSRSAPRPWRGPTNSHRCMSCLPPPTTAGRGVNPVSLFAIIFISLRSHQVFYNFVIDSEYVV